MFKLVYRSRFHYTTRRIIPFIDNSIWEQFFRTSTVNLKKYLLSTLSFPMSILNTWIVSPFTTFSTTMLWIVKSFKSFQRLQLRASYLENWNVPLWHYWLNSTSWWHTLILTPVHYGIGVCHTYLFHEVNNSSDGWSTLVLTLSGTPRRSIFHHL